MTPFERVKIRSKALETLGVSGNPSKTEIKKAFRKLAFEKHPDRGTGTHEEFALISDAYQLLYDSAADDNPPPADTADPSFRVSRPSAKLSETAFDHETVSACHALLDDLEVTGARHAATRLARKGRMLTYIVPGRPADGLNKVALPVGDLIDRRRVQLDIIDIWSGDLCGDVYDVPAQDLRAVIPRRPQRSDPLRFRRPPLTRSLLRTGQRARHVQPWLFR